MTDIASTRVQRLLVADCLDLVLPVTPSMSEAFYRHLFQLHSEATIAFRGSATFRQRKLASTLQTFRYLKYLDQLAPLLAALGQRHQQYYRHYQKLLPFVLESILVMLQERLGTGLSPEIEDAWRVVFTDTILLMTQPVNDQQVLAAQRLHSALARHDTGLLTDIGGIEVIKKIHDAFYRRLFEDPWLGQFFLGKHEDILSEKQTAFMVNAFGGQADYRGAMPAFVHMHMFITAEQADIREQYLLQAILNAGLDETIAKRWLAIDRLFRPAVVKKSPDDCVLLCQGQFAIQAKKPLGYVSPFTKKTPLLG